MGRGGGRHFTLTRSSNAAFFAVNPRVACEHYQQQAVRRRIYRGSVWSRKWSRSRRAGLSQLPGATWQADFVFAVVSARSGSVWDRERGDLDTAFVQPRCVLGGNTAPLRHCR